MHNVPDKSSTHQEEPDILMIVPAGVRLRLDELQTGEGAHSGIIRRNRAVCQRDNHVGTSEHNVSR